MLRKWIKLFRFDYLSPHDLLTCIERFAPEYENRLIDDGLIDSNDRIRRSVNLYVNKKGVVVVNSLHLGGGLTYRLFLEESDAGTVLHCKHNPFRDVAFLVPTLIAVLPLVISIHQLLVFFRTGDDSIIIGVLGGLSLFSLIIGICTVFEIVARDAVDKLLEQLIDAEPKPHSKDGL